MKTILRFTSAVIAAVLLFCLVSCGKEAEKETYTVRVGCIKGPTGIGMAKLINDNEKKETGNTYKFTVAASPDEISGKIISGEIDIASVPTNMAAKLYAKTGGKIRMLAANTLGVLSIIEAGEEINKVNDLKGKTIYSTGEGSNPEYILRYILKENGIDPDTDVTLEFVSANDELVSYLISGQATVAMVPEPAATTVLVKKENLRRALSINDEWDKVSSGNLIMGCVVSTEEFAKSHSDEIKVFLEEYEKSIDFAMSKTEEAAALCEKYEITATAAVAEKAIPECNLVYIDGTELKERINEYFGILESFDKSSIGGTVPGDEFYFTEK